MFAGRASAELWLDWDDLPPGMPVEARLSRLTRWALLARERELRFGLKIPGATVPLDEGLAHMERCLKELALHGT